MKIGTFKTQFTLGGVPVIYAGLTEFRIFQRFTLKEDVRPLFADRRRVLAEVLGQARQTGDGTRLMPTLRILSMASNLFHLHPRDYPYSSITAFTNFAGEHDFCVNWESKADCEQLGLTLDDQLRHWDGMFTALRDAPNAMLSLGNESGFQGDGRKNGWTREHFERVPMVCSRGSNLGGDYPPAESWDYADYHTRRDGIKGLAACGRYLPFVVGGDDEATPKWPGLKDIPVVVNEWLGAGDQMEPGRRTNRPADHYRAAFDMAAWAAGGCYHSQNGIDSVLFSDRQFACGLAHFMGLSKADPIQSFDGTLGY